MPPDNGVRENARVREGRHILLTCALLAAAPGIALAVPVGGTTRWLATGPGEQYQASIDAGFVVFTSRDASGADVLLVDLGSGATTVMAGGTGDQDQPDLARDVLAYRTAEGIALQFLLSGALLRRPAEPGAGAPVAAAAGAAWEQGPAGDRDIAWYQTTTGAQGVLAEPGDQHGPSISGTTVAFVDEAQGGAVVAYDVLRKTQQVLVPGPVASVSLDGTGPNMRAAVARITATGDADIEVWDATGAIVGTLVVPGDQRNPRLAGDWVAFEDRSTGRSQLVVWNVVTGIAYLPVVSTSAQTLGDEAATRTELSVAFSQSNGVDLDLALYTLPLPAVDDGAGSNWPPKPTDVPPAHCDDPSPRILASFTLGRGRPEPQAGEVSFTTGDGRDLPVLVCMDEVGVDDAWVTLDGVVIATPADFAPVNAHVESRRTILAGDGLVSAVMEGRCGGRLSVTVLADPGSIPDPPPAAPTGGGLPVTVRAIVAAGEAGGCGSGPAGPLALVGLAVAMVLRRRGTASPRPG